jgi:hypothetical protein
MWVLILTVAVAVNLVAFGVGWWLMVRGGMPAPPLEFIGDPEGDGEEGDLFADCSYRA